jgi:ABC-type glutathione transport system ATPase component
MRGIRMAGWPAAARRGKDGPAADSPKGCAGRSWLRRQRGDLTKARRMMTAVIEVTGLTKRYGGKSVVDDISFHVDQGEIFGILGPNGAGKTTAVECMEGLRRRDDGEVRILGLDPLNDRHRLHQRIGVQLQLGCVNGSRTMRTPESGCMT